ncbi:MAG: glycoside hydrolase, partial [Verrucomicrobiae bacterium]|nr:glycoside hydrolase [Verrucomicrobiae bacterium]
WGPDIPDTIALPPVDGSMIRYSANRNGDDRDRIFFSCAEGSEGLNRNILAIWTSYNEGKSFINPVQVNHGFAAYSVLARLRDGRIGLLVETATEQGSRYGEITFYRIGLAQLEK